jgi:threonine 3-dehydrogenase
MLSPLGQVRWIGTPATSFEFDFGTWRKSRPVIFNISGRRIWQTWEQTAPLVYGRCIDLKPVISHVLPLRDSARAFELILAGEAIKPLIVCS